MRIRCESRSLTHRTSTGLCHYNIHRQSMHNATRICKPEQGLCDVLPFAIDTKIFGSEECRQISGASAARLLWVSGSCFALTQVLLNILLQSSNVFWSLPSFDSTLAAASSYDGRSFVSVLRARTFPPQGSRPSSPDAGMYTGYRISRLHPFKDASPSTFSLDRGLRCLLNQLHQPGGS